MDFEDVLYPYPEKSVTTAEVRVVYVDEGKGTPVLFLPAAGRGLTHYEKVYPAFLEAGYRVIGVDLPGWGKSEKPDASYSVEWYLHWLERFIAALGLERVVLVGNSLGGLLAGILASRSASLVPAVVLIAPAGGPVSFVKRQLAHFFLDENRLRSPSPRQFRMAISQSFHKPVPELEQIVERGLAIAQGKGWPDYCRALSRGARAALVADLLPHLSQIACPALLLWGREDRVCPIEWTRRFAPALRRGKLVPIESCGHFPPIEASAETRAAILGWLADEGVKA